MCKIFSIHAVFLYFDIFRLVPDLNIETTRVSKKIIILHIAFSYLSPKQYKVMKPSFTILSFQTR
uniref:Uncharacterized protein n=1 Tax=Manihot esculenta TaxID=3983 RepID=A0A2C9U815_MANES